MDLKCLNGIIEKGLAVHIDLTSNESWNLNHDFTSISLNQWSNASSDELSLYDFGLTAYDNGRVSKMWDTLSLTPEDTKLTLYRVGYNTSTGGTFYDGYGMTGVTETEYIYGREYSGTTGATTTGATWVGNHINLNGGFFQGFYKLYNYNYEILPARFNHGVTIETIVRVDPNSYTNGVLFLMGERAEDKYNSLFSGETTQVEPTKISTLNQKTVIEYVSTSGFTGVTTGEGNYLAPYKTGQTTQNTVKNFDKKQFNSFIFQPKTSINGNVAALFLASGGELAFRYIDDNGIVRTRYSDNKIPTGWTIITLAFKPYEVLEDDPEVLECAPRRKGDFVVYVRGRQFWKITDFNEFFFKNVKQQKEKQLGVPFNLSWGGGSFGLQHSWHWDYKTVEIYNGNDQAYINSNFIQKTNPLIDDKCVMHITGTSATTGVALISNSSTFFVEDECYPDIENPVTVLEINQVATGMTGTSSGMTGASFYFEYDQPFEMLSNREYVITAKIYDPGMFNRYYSQYPVTSKLEIVVYGTVDIEVIEDISYDGTKPNQWITISKRIKLADNTALQSVQIGISAESSAPFISGYKLYIDDFQYRGADMLVQDPSKSNLTIENNFSNSFIGGIQKLRIYDFAFNSEQALHNAYWELKGNPALGFNVSRGGRIIYR